MKRLAVVPLLAMAATVAHAELYLDRARVTSVDPQYESIRVPRQECSNRWISEPRQSGGREYGGAVLGGVVGALIGNQVGRGHGREAATAVGAVVGAVTGDNLSTRNRWDRTDETLREVTRCRNVDEEQTRIVGYQVSYEYRDQQFKTLMHEHPGRYLPVRVSVEPVER